MESIIEYVLVKAAEWSDLCAIARSRRLDFIYSVEDAENGGIEYHVHTDLDEVESVVWAIRVMREATLREPEAAVAYGVDMP